MVALSPDPCEPGLDDGMTYAQFVASTHRRVSGLRLDSDATVIDDLAVEEPLEIRIGDGRTVLRSVVTMRTPGADLELAAGWLRGEGIVQRSDDLVAVRACTDPSLLPEARGNVVTADLAAPALPRLATLGRATDITGACGVCGAESLEQVVSRVAESLTVTGSVMTRDTVLALTEALRDAQRVFARTGGLHGAAVADTDGRLLAVREDVGRHNAVDKVTGWALMNDATPSALVVSSRASFEIVQKAAASHIPIVVTVSAPSTLAVDLAERTGITLAAFAREGRATVYTHSQRVT